MPDPAWMLNLRRKVGKPHFWGASSWVPIFSGFQTYRFSVDSSLPWLVQFAGRLFCAELLCNTPDSCSYLRPMAFWAVSEATSERTLMAMS
jgi:hypothetical protein